MLVWLTSKNEGLCDLLKVTTMYRRVVDINKIRALRKFKQNMSQNEMAERLGYNSIAGYSYLETGKARFDAETLAEVADILDVSIEELLTTNQEQETGTNKTTAN